MLCSGVCRIGSAATSSNVDSHSFEGKCLRRSGRCPTHFSPETSSRRSGILPDSPASAGANSRRARLGLRPRVGQDGRPASREKPHPVDRASCPILRRQPEPTVNEPASGCARGSARMAEPETGCAATTTGTRRLSTDRLLVRHRWANGPAHRATSDPLQHPADTERIPRIPRAGSPSCAGA